MTDYSPSHGPFEELAAGYALDALEPADDQRFLRHARQCQACPRALAGFREVAAALAEIGPSAEPSPQLADRILSAALADLSSGGPPGVIPLRPRTRWWLQPVTAAAAVALIAGGGIWAGLTATTTSPLPSVASCAHARGCTVVVLTAAATHREAARLLVDKQAAWVVPVAMKANDTADQIYVLWQITGSHRPLAVGSFDVRLGLHVPINIGPLAAPYRGTLAFAVSLEQGRTIPAAPSRVQALGQVT